MKDNSVFNAEALQARLEELESLERFPIELDVLDYFGLKDEDITERTPIVTDFGHIVNIVAMYVEKLNNKRDEGMPDR